MDFNFKLEVDVKAEDLIDSMMVDRGRILDLLYVLGEVLGKRGRASSRSSYISNLWNSTELQSFSFQEKVTVTYLLGLMHRRSDDEEKGRPFKLALMDGFKVGTGLREEEE